MATLSKDAILSADDRKLQKVKVPEWGGEVFVRAMTSVERDDYEQKWFNWRKNRNYSQDDYRYFNAFLAVFVICDEGGKPVFCVNDVEALGDKSAKALERVNRIAQRLNGITAADIEELAKNSDSAPSA